MLNERLDVLRKSVQTTLYLPLGLYLGIFEKAKKEKTSIAEIVRRAVIKELESEK